MDLIASRNTKIFVSYTVRDGKIGIGFLKKLFLEICDICCAYVDLLHNNSFNKQERVIRELLSSDFVFLIKTEQILNSNWVKTELLLACEFGIPVLTFEYVDLVEKKLQPISKAVHNIIMTRYKSETIM